MRWSAAFMASASARRSSARACSIARAMPRRSRWCISSRGCGSAAIELLDTQFLTEHLKTFGASRSAAGALRQTARRRAIEEEADVSVFARALSGADALDRDERVIPKMGTGFQTRSCAEKLAELHGGGSCGGGGNCWACGCTRPEAAAPSRAVAAAGAADAVPAAPARRLRARPRRRAAARLCSRRATCRRSDARSRAGPGSRRTSSR